MIMSWGVRKNGNDHEREARVHPASPDRRGRQGDGGLHSQTIAGNNWNLAGFGDTPMTPKSGHIRIGIGGWTFEPWRGVFYPKGLPHAKELPYAAERLTSIEVNGTFYRSRKPATPSNVFSIPASASSATISAPCSGNSRRPRSSIPPTSAASSSICRKN